MLLVGVVPKVYGLQGELSMVRNVILQTPTRSKPSLIRLGAMDSRQLRGFSNNAALASLDFGRTFVPNTSLAAEQLLANPSRACSHSFSSSSGDGDGSKESKRGYGPYISLTPEEQDLFRLLRRARAETHLSTTLRVAGGWVRDKLLATREFSRPSEGNSRLTSKFNKPASMGRKGIKVIGGQDDDEFQPVDIDIALDDMLGREFADHLNEYLSQVGEETISVGVVLKNPEKSKHLETATMKVGTFWIDFVNLRAEQYTQDSRIPDLMRIGTPAEDAFRRDLTINALFYNINNGQIEDWTGRGFDDLRRGIVATPLAPLTTLLDDPLRTLRSVRFAARLRFTMDEALVEAAMNERVRKALAEKVSRERVGGEVDLMLRSQDPVGAMRLLINLKLVETVFPISHCIAKDSVNCSIFDKGLELLSATHDHLCDCKIQLPLWCEAKSSFTTNGVDEIPLVHDEDARRILWYAAFLKPLFDHSNMLPQAKKSRRAGKRANASIICKLLVDELKRPTRDGIDVEKVMRAADDFTRLINSGCDLSAYSILLSDIRVVDSGPDEDGKHRLTCSMNGQPTFSATEDDPVWEHAMEFRLLCARVLKRVGPLWRAALILSLSEQLAALGSDELEYTIEGDIIDESLSEERKGQIERYDAFAVALQRIGLIGIWDEKPLLDGVEIKKVLPRIPKGPTFREVMDEQDNWMVAHPCAPVEILVKHMMDTFPEYL